MKYKNYITNKEQVLKHPYIKDCLVYDIETDSTVVNKAKMKFIGFYSYKHNKYMLFNSNEKARIQQVIDEHRILIGFHNKHFDGPIMLNNGFDIKYKVVFDCLSVLYDFDRRRPNREPIIKLPNGEHLSHALPNRKMKTVAKVLGLSTEKGDIDYDIFKKYEWSEQELKDIYRYLLSDVDITRQIFEYYVVYFDKFTELVGNDNIRKFNYIRSSTGSFAYSALCNLTNMEPLYEEDEEIKMIRPENEGGFVLDPQVPYAEGRIIYADFASLYPHIMFMCNLFSPQDDGWSGGDFFDLQSSYKCDELGTVEKTLKWLYMNRCKMKQMEDARELGYKVVLNSIYGISGSPSFKNVFNMSTSGDTTAIGRKMIQFTADEFSKHGFRTIYGDTDSCFIILPEGKSVDDFNIIAVDVIEKLKSRIPFPVDTFKLDIDDIFSKVWLFKKKHYIGFNENGKFIIKGLPIIKHDATALGKKIFLFLKPLMVQKQNIKFDRSYIESLIDQEINTDITLVGRTYNVRKFEEYDKKTSIQSQIAEVYGEGSHFLIPNRSIGKVGKSKKYCTIEESSSLSINDLILDKVWKELDPFIQTI